MQFVTKICSGLIEKSQKSGTSYLPDRYFEKLVIYNHQFLSETSQTGNKFAFFLVFLLIVYKYLVEVSYV